MTTLVKETAQRIEGPQTYELILLIFNLIFRRQKQQQMTYNTSIIHVNLNYNQI